jgi:hypothetical protein
VARGHATPGEILASQLCYFIASVALTSARSDGRQSVSVTVGFNFQMTETEAGYTVMSCGEKRDWQLTKGAVVYIAQQYNSYILLY